MEIIARTSAWSSITRMRDIGSCGIGFGTAYIGTSDLGQAVRGTIPAVSKDAVTLAGSRPV
jgi:hypothetical protein